MSEQFVLGSIDPHSGLSLTLSGGNASDALLVVQSGRPQPTIRLSCGLRSCDRFDFSTLFEETVLASLPCVLVLLLVPFRLRYLRKRPIVIRSPVLFTIKVGAWAALALLQIAMVISSTINRFNTTSASLASGIITAISTVALLVLSTLEHSRSLRPSVIIQTFLFVISVFDAIRVRTLWLASISKPGIRPSVSPTVFTTAFGIQLLILVLESLTKTNHAVVATEHLSPEEVAGIFSTSLLLWVNPLLRAGYKKNLTLYELFPIDSGLSSHHVYDKVSQTWNNANQKRKHSLALTVLQAFLPQLCIFYIPRLAAVALSLAQPFLIKSLIAFVQDTSMQPIEYGYGLVGAYGLVYIGMAISTLWWGQLTSCILTAVRGSLIALIYHGMLSLRAETGNSSSAVSLMSTDVDRVMVTLQWCLGIVPNLIQVGLALWILHLQMGVVMIVPIIMAIVSGTASTYVGKLVPGRQRKWMQAVQKRVGVTSETIGSIKGVKMTGLSNKVQDQIQGMRDFELEESKRFRHVQISNILIGQFPSIMTPSVTFAAYAIAQKVSGGNQLDVVTAFTSLSLLNILINPVAELVMASTNMASAVNCLDRIQEFLLKEKQEDYRQFETFPSRASAGLSAGHVRRNYLIRILDGSFGWAADKPTVKNIGLEILPSTLTVIVGPVGSGKSTLLKAIVGETYKQGGLVEFGLSAEVAYCDQDPWILNRTVKDNIVGAGSFSQEGYDRVIQACQLQEDIDLMPKGDETIVGSQGAALSGGQRHRIALARAAYSGKKIIIVDDSLKGLDASTAAKCFQALLGKNSLMRGPGRAVILATHDAQWLPFADQIIALDKDGRITERGTYAELSLSGGYVSKLRVMQAAEDGEGSSGIKSDVAKIITSTTSETLPLNETAQDEKAKKRGAANTSALIFYIKSMGRASFPLFISMVLFQSACRTMLRLWVKIWVSANEANPNENGGLYAGIYFLFAVLTEISLAMETFFFLVIVVPKSANGLHSRILTAAMSAPLSFFVKTDAGEIINRFSQDMNLIDLPLPIAFMLFFDFIALVTAQLILACIATGYLAIVVPLIMTVLYCVQRVYLQTSRQMRLLEIEAKAPVFSHFISSFSGLVTIRAFNWVSEVHEENLKRLDMSQRPFYLLYCLQWWLKLVLDLVVAAMAVILAALTVGLRNKINPGYLGVALVSVMTVGQLLAYLLNYWATLETSLGAIARIQQFSSETPKEKDGGDPREVGWPRRGAIRMRDVSAAYGEHTVLHDITLDIEPGQKVAVCGRTGSGKSTLLALFLRLHDPSEGAIEIDGTNINTVPLKQLRKQLASLPQDPLFLSGTVRFNLDPFEEADDGSITDALGKTGLRSLIEERGGLDAELKSDWLSAGQKQLFCMSRALLRHSRVLLLDEATSSLDQHTEQVVQDLLRTEFRGWTTVVIAHRLRTIVDSDKVIVLRDGKVVEFESPKKLLEQDSEFRSLWKLQESE